MRPTRPILFALFGLLLAACTSGEAETSMPVPASTPAPTSDEPVPFAGPLPSPGPWASSMSGDEASGSEALAIETELVSPLVRPDPQDEARLQRSVDGIVGRMSRSEMVGQVLMTAVPGTTAYEGGRDLVRDLHLGGILLRGDNVTNDVGLRAMVDGLQSVSRPLPLFVATDHEGGVVVSSHFGGVMTEFPDAYTVGSTQDPAHAAAIGTLSGRELRALGFTMNLAPVLDTRHRGGTSVVGRRAYSMDPVTAARMGLAYTVALQAEGVVASGKHFPGHGKVTGDPHTSRLRPVPTYDREDLLPFRTGIAGGVGSVMTAHVTFEDLDPDLPASVSEKVVAGMLRTELGYEGVIVTDSLGMGAISQRWPIPEAAVMALEAGSDLILSTSQAPEMHEAITEAVRTGRISEDRLEASVRRIVTLKLRFADRWAADVPLSVLRSSVHRSIVRDVQRAAR